MKISIANISNQGSLAGEVITLKVGDDCNLKNYILADASYTKEDELTRAFRHTLWFPPKDVKKGDYVLVYSKEGSDSARPHEGGSTIHVYHWHSEAPIWHESEDAAILLELSSCEVERTRSYVSFV